MMKWGIIGTGNMGKILLHALIKSEAVKESDLHIHNRTLMKAYELLNQYPDLKVENDVEDIAKRCHILFLCAKPKEIISIAHQLKNVVHEEQIIISITSSISPIELEAILPCKTARIVPSITNQSLSGATLISYGNRLTDVEQLLLHKTCQLFSTPYFVTDDNVRIASDLVSCGPAFMSYLLEGMIQAATEERNISRKEAEELVETMMIGYGKLLEDNYFTLETLRKKVMVKGGITGIGIDALEEGQNARFNHVFQKTHKKFDEEKEILKQMIFSTKTNR